MAKRSAPKAKATKKAKTKMDHEPDARDLNARSAVQIEAEHKKTTKKSAKAKASPKTKNGNGHLSAANEHRLADVARKLSSTRKLDEASVIQLGRKLIKLESGERKSPPNIPPKLKPSDRVVVAEALGLKKLAARFSK